MTFGQFLTILRARFALVASVFLIGVLGALALTLLVPRQYTSVARVLVEHNGADKSPAAASSSGSVSNLVSTHRDLIASPLIALKVVQALKLDQNVGATARLLSAFNPVATAKEWLASLLPDRGPAPELSPKYWIADRLSRNLSVTASRDSQMIRIAYTSRNPRFSAEVTNAFTRAYVDANTNIKASPAKAEAGRFDEQLKQMRADLEQAEGKLAKFQQDKGIIATDERLDVENQRLAELTGQAALAQSEAFAFEARRRQLRGFIDGRGGAADAPAEVASSPAVLQLRQEIAAREAKLSELSNRIGPNHPQYQAAQAEIKQLRGELTRTSRSMAASLMSNSDVAGQREASLRGALEQQKTRILKMKGDREQLAMLARDVDNAQKSYNDAMQKRSQSRMDLEVGRSNVAVVDEASAPLRPSFPNTTLNVAIGGLAGLVLGIGLALTREAGTRYVRSEADLVDLLRVPMLAVLPPRLPGARSARQALSANVYLLTKK